MPPFLIYFEAKVHGGKGRGHLLEYSISLEHTPPVPNNMQF